MNMIVWPWAIRRGNGDLWIVLHPDHSCVSNLQDSVRGDQDLIFQIQWIALCQNGLHGLLARIVMIMAA